MNFSLLPNESSISEVRHTVLAFDSPHAFSYVIGCKITMKDYAGQSTFIIRKSVFLRPIYPWETIALYNLCAPPTISSYKGTFLTL